MRTAAGSPRADAERFAALAAAALHREYPNHLHHMLASDEDARPPRELTPMFFGCLDWHSAVHGHWTLVRLLRLFPEAHLAASARAALERSFTADNARGECAYLSAPGRAGFERPYGIAWLLLLCAELREWNEVPAVTWLDVLSPLEAIALERMRTWLPALPAPIRTGEHNQTAFSLGLVLDACRSNGDETLARSARSRAAAFFGGDVDAPVAYEPGGYDFLSPALAEADLMRRVLGAESFSAWLSAFLPGLESASADAWLEPVRSPDRADGKLSHLDGLNLSRAWMMEGVAAVLGERDVRSRRLRAAARAHREASLPAISSEHYAGSHWLGTFGMYLVTGRGLPPGAGEPA